MGLRLGIKGLIMGLIMGPQVDLLDPDSAIMGLIMDPGLAIMGLILAELIIEAQAVLGLLHEATTNQSGEPRVKSCRYLKPSMNCVEEQKIIGAQGGRDA